MKSLVSILVALSTIQTAHALVNLLEKNKHFKKIPVYNQGKIGNCYSFASVNLYDYLRSSRGVELTQENLTSTLWASVLYKDKSFMGFISQTTGISFDQEKPLNSGDAANTLGALEKYGSCGRKTVQEGIYAKFPELKSSKVKLTVEEFTGIVHLIEKEWNKHFSYAYSQYLNDNSPGFVNNKYKFPSARISLTTRPTWKEKEQASINQIQDFDFKDYFEPSISVQDATYVAPTYLPPIVVKKKVPTIQNTTTNTSTNTTTNNNERGFVEINDNFMPSYHIAVKDNTYVSPEYLGLYASYSKMSAAYADATIRSGLKKKHGVSFKFVDTLLDAIQNENGYWSVVKEVVKPCFKKAKILKKDLIIKQRLPYSYNDFVSTVETILGNSKPVAIEYCSEMLKSGQTHGAMKSKKCGMHLSVIVGHRVRAGKHQMLIQNSWGQSCGSYSKKWDCYKDQGAVWVDSYILSHSSYRIVWLSK